MKVVFVLIMCNIFVLKQIWNQLCKCFYKTFLVEMFCNLLEENWMKSCCSEWPLRLGIYVIPWNAYHFIVFLIERQRKQRININFKFANNSQFMSFQKLQELVTVKHLKWFSHTIRVKVCQKFCFTETSYLSAIIYIHCKRCENSAYFIFVSPKWVNGLVCRPDYKQFNSFATEVYRKIVSIFIYISLNMFFILITQIYK